MKKQDTPFWALVVSGFGVALHWPAWLTHHKFCCLVQFWCR